MSSWKVKDVIEAIGPLPLIDRLSAPAYNPPLGQIENPIALAVASMKEHMTDEGWQIMDGLKYAGYRLCGHNLDNLTDVPTILRAYNPSVIFVQDKREWDVSTKDFRDPKARFIRPAALREYDCGFKLTILKDSQQRPEYHRQSADEMGVHAWVIYYHPRVVCHLAGYLRPEHLIRTYHSVDSDKVPSYTHVGRTGTILSGATSGAYPLRTRLIREIGRLHNVHHIPHPGYHRNGSATTAFLQMLSNFKVAICTASRYGYALRKMIEATACGCAVLTDLPEDEVLPEIDENLVRVHPSTSTRQIGDILNRMTTFYNPDKQALFAARAKAWYDYRILGLRLADQIEEMRDPYP